MTIAGITKTSTIDYPGTICTVVFTGGCNFRCAYCHNPELINYSGVSLKCSELINSLLQRRKFIDAICITGGEPCLQADLNEYIRRIKEHGFKVKLDTNGSRPDVLKKLLNEGIVDYVAMDLKAPYEKYQSVVSAICDISSIKKSVGIIRDCGIDYEFRTTICKPLLNTEDLVSIAESIKHSKRFYIQKYRKPITDSRNSKEYTSFTQTELDYVIEYVGNWFEICKIR